MRTSLLVGSLLLLCPAETVRAQSDSTLLRRSYAVGQRLEYRIRGSHDQDGVVTTYDATARGVVTRDSLGRIVEDFVWSSPALGATADTTRLRQRVSLSRAVIPAPPDFRRFDLRLVGPALDFLTFYVDLWLAMRQPPLTKVGASAYVPFMTNGVWTDGQHVILGEDAVAFDIRILSAPPIGKNDPIVLSVKHVPPPRTGVPLPAPWMSAVVDTAPPAAPNNWVQVTKESDSGVTTYHAAVGRETFDVTLVLSPVDGRILHATMVNPVTAVERVCVDASLANCGSARPYHVIRRIELTAATGAGDPPMRYSDQY